MFFDSETARGTAHQVDSAQGKERTAPCLSMLARFSQAAVTSVWRKWYKTSWRSLKWQVANYWIKTLAHIILCRPTTEIQDGGRHAGSKNNLERLDIATRFQRLCPHLWPCPTHFWQNPTLLKVARLPKFKIKEKKTGSKIVFEWQVMALRYQVMSSVLSKSGMIQNVRGSR